MTTRPMLCVCASLLFFPAASLRAQQKLPDVPQPLDPARVVAQPKLESALHTPLKEEYIWTAVSPAVSRPMYAQVRLAEVPDAHYFRRTFDVATVPAKATLYVAGPRRERVYVNGTLAD